MDSRTRAVVTAAVAGGYVVGRTRKAKMIFAVGTFVAGRRFGLTPTALAAEALKQLRENSQLADLREQISGELLTAVRSAATASADRGLSSLAGVLRERGRADGGKPEGADDIDEEDQEGGDGPGDAEKDGRAESRPRRRSDGGKAAPRQRAEPRKKAAKKTVPAKKEPSGRAAPARRAGKKTAPGRSPSHANRQGR
ncbi:hypothetical protein SAMN05216223_13427 [Actinacidiphila yanglinensis]|uniref:Histone protein n=1 Tax=Actinacidiphila yanglinensis TaxID=310779 RepID=A0A1H6ECV7_9ACTN|nr:hypothetical protein [Actinacidiphila yanglinensis]SEG95630.1 hypothetical protein SAMN05216223_13427 [Actinacidiphila yanglinensis]